MIRIYFNTQKEAPQVWSLDEGSHASEICVQDVLLKDASGLTHYNPDAVYPDPKAWIQFDNAQYSVSRGIATIKPISHRP